MRLSLLLLVSQYVFTQVLGVALIEKFDADLKAEFLKAHNDIRGQVSNPKASNMQTMMWNEGLARVAEANVKTCVMKHTSKENRKTSEFELVGENLYDHWGGNNSLVDIGHRAVRAWYSEIKDYHFENRSCTGKMCGHYTQVVWATSYQVGCAIAICDGGDKQELDGILVCCNYGPAGNQVGPDGPHSPYKNGDPCTECYEGQSCNNNLCRTPDGVTPPPELQPTLGVQKLSEDMKDDIIKEHNDHRREVSDPQATNMQMLTWDDELAEVAEGNVKNCVLGHTPLENRRTSTFYPTGENLYTYRGSDKSLDGIANRMVTKWFNEKKDYHYNNRTCNKGKMCGHYTQLIWATTYKVGCAIAICDGKEGEQLNGILACCSYGPYGNVYDGNGLLSPYTSGEPCTGCNDGQQCKDKLCYTPAFSPSPSKIPIQVHQEVETTVQGSGNTKAPESTTTATTSKMAPTTTTTPKPTTTTSKAITTTTQAPTTAHKAPSTTTTTKVTTSTPKATTQAPVTTPKDPTTTTTTPKATTTTTTATTTTTEVLTTTLKDPTTTTTTKATTPTPKATTTTTEVLTTTPKVPTTTTTTEATTPTAITTAKATTTTSKATTSTTKATTTAKVTPKPPELTNSIRLTTSVTMKPVQSSSTTKMADPSATTETAGPTQSISSTKTPESTKHDNVTRSTPVSTTSGGRGIHNIHLFLVTVIISFMRWFLFIH